MTTQQDSVTSSNSLLGRVKWFNNTTGYGFITVLSGEHTDTDIFVHHSAIQVENQQYKYLVQGEYVSFVLSKSSGPHEYQATHVVGVANGKLMCETRREFKIARNNYKEHASQPVKEVRVSNKSETVRKTKEPRKTEKSTAPKVRGEGPRGKNTTKTEWTLVENTIKPTRRYNKPARKESELNSGSHV